MAAGKWRRSCAFALACALGATACSGGTKAPRAASSSPRPAVATPSLGTTEAGGAKPNIVFVLTDDLAWNLVQYMPRVQKLQTQGITFSNYFVSDSLCCPSRSSIFTGRF